MNSGPRPQSSRPTLATSGVTHLRLDRPTRSTPTGLEEFHCTTQCLGDVLITHLGTEEHRLTDTHRDATTFLGPLGVQRYRAGEADGLEWNHRNAQTDGEQPDARFEFVQLGGSTDGALGGDENVPPAIDHLTDVLEARHIRLAAGETEAGE